MPPTNQYNQPMVSPPPQPGAGKPAMPLKDKKPWGLIISLVLTAILLVASLGFGYWAFSGRQNYKNNSDQISSEAVKKAKQEQEKTLNEAFAEKEKSPLKSYTTPAQYGGVKIVYPKTWSAYVVELNQGSGMVVDGFYYPGFVPNVTAPGNNYFLRVQISSNSYSAELTKYKAQVKVGKLRSAPFVPDQVKGATVGIRLDGQIEASKKGSLVILPLRDKVLKIWTENESAAKDFDSYVLKNLTYSP